MSENTRTSADYTMGYSEEFRQMLDRRSARTHAAYLLPHLASGQRMLDFGCGPGTITVGLAKAVEPGELHGMDMEESQVELARTAAAAGGHTNVTFHTGDVTDLPFEDDYFDVAHCHAVLMHVPDTEATLKEVKRVLKPGGLIASREANVASSFMAPAADTIQGAWDTFARLLAANRGHPQMGRELKARFVEAGFTDIRATASFDMFGTPKTWFSFIPLSATGSSRPTSWGRPRSTASRPGSSSTSGAGPSMNGKTTPAPSGASPSASAWRPNRESADPESELISD